jgi:hypothetical protein
VFIVLNPDYPKAAALQEMLEVCPMFLGWTCALAKSGFQRVLVGQELAASLMATQADVFRWLVLFVALAGLSAGCKCHSACDCKPGYACFHGTCASGTAAVFCCSACPAGAPAGQMCDWPDGGHDSCGGR